MRRTLPFVALWFAAGALAVVVAMAGVAVVDDQLTASRPAPLSAEEVQERVRQAAATSTTTGDVTTTPTTAPASGTTSTTTAPPTSTGGSDDPATGGPVTPTTTVAAPVTRTYELVGGTTTIRFSSSGVTVLSSTPKPGFTTEVEREGTGWKVEFESDAHKSRIDAWWANGPQARVREEADD